METSMELRHLSYFVAVAEEGSLTAAAERRLHTAQPSLSRQIRDLEYEVGAQLLTRSAHGIELTPAGHAFLEHARQALAQADAAVHAARRAVKPSKPSFALGFIAGQEMYWLPKAMNVLKDQLPTVDVTVSSDYSHELANAIMGEKLDLAFMRPEVGMSGVQYRGVVKEPIVVFLPSDHRLASRSAIALQDIVGEPFLGISNMARSLQVVIDDYLTRSGVDLPPTHRFDNLLMAISLISSTRGVTLLPAYAGNFLPQSVVSRPLKGDDQPTIDLVVGYNGANTSPILELFLSRLDTLISRCRTKCPDIAGLLGNGEGRL
jgi:LysR family transcriptional regulator, hca operon transcriptional activator